ncbi:MAG: metalloregulator ArsR/SmtB family transcription factor [Acidobacteriia bacterium]|nr:metalloregulator ArsR/SmtB family transcription factor [Terriglobia bacterium]
MKDSLRRFKAEIFQGLAHPTRIAIVEALRIGELPAGRLIDQLELEQANASQHLSVLRAKKIVVNRKVGNQVFYSLRDPVLIDVLDILRRYFSSQLTDTVNMLEEMGPEETARKSATPPKMRRKAGRRARNTTGRT